jgi:hypothetical protein
MLVAMFRLLAGLLAVLAVSFADPALAAPKPPPVPQWAWDHVERVVVFGDLHGDYDKFHDMLLQAGLIDAKDNWAGGKTHLVQVGDVPDRAPGTRRILDLLIKLEGQAPKKGGYVHALIGNHEAMNMDGDLRYTTPGEFAAFADKDSARKRDLYYAAVVRNLTEHPPTDGTPPPVIDDAFRAKFDAQVPLGWVEHRLAWSPTGKYGKWILGHSAIIRIDDAIYLHGGISPAFETLDVPAINKAVVDALAGKPADPAGPQRILESDDSPLWYRGMAQQPEAVEAPNVAAALAHFGVKHIVLGHTKQYPMINERFDGAVLLTDIAAANRCADPHAFLVREGDHFSTVYRGQRLDLGLSGPAHDAYLAQIAAIDVAHPPPATCP